MRNIIHPVSVGPDIIRGKITIDSDTYFNEPKRMAEIKKYEDIIPVDVFGGFVPEDKSMANLKKTEDQINKRFGLKLERKEGE